MMDAPPMPSPTLLLVDGHALAYRQFFALERTAMATSTGQPSWTAYGFFSALQGVLQAYQPQALAFAFERAIAALEGATHGFAFSSGLAAMAAILDGVPAGSHMVATDDLYGGSYRLIERVRKHSAALTVTYLDLTNLAALDAAITEQTNLLWVETPTNPLLKLADIAAIAQIAKTRGVTLVVDNTFASPALQNPLALGADLVLHSATKYINGHSDVIGGVVVTSHPEWAEKIGFIQNSVGRIAGALDSF